MSRRAPRLITGGRRQESTTSSATRRCESSPKASGECARRRLRRPWASAVRTGGTRAIHCIGRKAGGRKFSKASQLVSTRRPIRSGHSVTTSWAIAPPVSLATSVTSASPSAAANSSTRRGDRARGEIGVRGHRRLVAAERPVGHDAAHPVELGHDVAPQQPVDEQAVEEEDDRALAARVAVADRSRRELDLVHGVHLVTPLAVAYRLYGSCIQTVRMSTARRRSRRRRAGACSPPPAPCSPSTATAPWAPRRSSAPPA